MHQDESVSLDDVMCHDLNADPGPARLLWIQMCAVPDRSMSVARSRGRCAPAVAGRIVRCTSYVCTSYVSRRASHVVCCISCVARRTLACHMLHVLRCTSYVCTSYVARAARSVLTAHARIQRRHCALAAARRVWRYLSPDKKTPALRPGRPCGGRAGTRPSRRCCPTRTTGRSSRSCSTSTSAFVLR
jgi:hypothetical protein